MTAAASDATPVVRKRDSAATRESLLDAARELFGSQGFEQTTLREIGERAGADPSLIARYFGNKVALYLAAIAADEPLFEDRQPPSMERLVRRTVRRADSVGAGPLIWSTIQPDADAEVKAVSIEHWTARVLAPLSKQLHERGVDHAELRAELVTAMMIGAIVVRTGGVMPAIANASSAEMSDELVDLLDRLLAP